MSNFMALSLNSEENAVCAFKAFGEMFPMAATNRAGYGVAYYHSSELLSRIAPNEQADQISVVERLGELNADIVIIHAREATCGSVHPKNTHPFTFQNWTMAHNGHFNGFETYQEQMLKSMPPYIKRGLQGDTDSEHLFHLFLSFMYDSGKMGRPRESAGGIVHALRQSISMIDEMGLANGFSPSDLSLVVSDGYNLVALSRGIPICYKLLDGLDDCSLCRISTVGTLKNDRKHRDLRGVLIISKKDDVTIPAGFSSLNDFSVMSITSEYTVNIASLK